MGLGYFMNDPQQGKQIKIEIVKQRPKDKPYGDLMMPLLAGGDAGADARPGLGRRPAARAAAGPARRRARRPSPMSRGSTPFGNDPFSPPANRAAGRRARASAPDSAAVPVPASRQSRSAARRCRRARRHVSQHPRHEHDRRRARPQRPVPQPVVRRHRHLGRRSPDRSLHDRRRGQQLSGLDGQRPDLREELRHLQHSRAPSATSSTARRFAGAASRFRSTSRPAT